MQAIKRDLDPKFYAAYVALREDMDKSTCKRRKVAAVLTLPDGFIVARGYNSQTSGYRHVCKNIPRQCGCVHAEVAAAARFYYDYLTQLVPLTALVTCAPCVTCYHALRLINVRSFWWVEDSEPGFETMELMAADHTVNYQRFTWLEEQLPKDSSKTLLSVS
jgi:deoxycytidylate deaminase